MLAKRNGFAEPEQATILAYSADGLDVWVEFADGSRRWVTRPQ